MEPAGAPNPGQIIIPDLLVAVSLEAGAENDITPAVECEGDWFTHDGWGHDIVLPGAFEFDGAGHVGAGQDITPAGALPDDKKCWT